MHPMNTHRQAIRSLNRLPLSLFNRLSGKPLRMRRPGMISRIVWVRPAELTTEPDIRNVEAPATGIMGVGEYDARIVQSIGIGSFRATSFSNTSYVAATASNQSSVNSRANYSMAYQAGAGVQLSERWSVESGIGYFRDMLRSRRQANPWRRRQMDLLANRIRNELATLMLMRPEQLPRTPSWPTMHLGQYTRYDCRM